jgi:small subunit ribosomal protein S21
MEALINDNQDLGSGPICAALPGCHTRKAPSLPFSVAVPLAPDPLHPSWVGEKGGAGVTTIVVAENEPLEAALRRFSRKVMQDGILSEARRRQRFETRSDKRKRKEAASRKRSRQRER